MADDLVISYKKGKFSDEEEQAIRKAVEFFRQVSLLGCIWT